MDTDTPVECMNRLRTAAFRAFYVRANGHISAIPT